MEKREEKKNRKKEEEKERMNRKWPAYHSGYDRI